MSSLSIHPKCSLNPPFPEKSIQVTARTWSIAKAKPLLPLTIPPKSNSDTAFIIIIGLQRLKELQLPNGSFVTASFNGTQHIARLCLSKTLKNDVLLSPLLAHNLHIFDSTLSLILTSVQYLELGYTLYDAPFPFYSHRVAPKVADKAVIAPLYKSLWKNQSGDFDQSDSYFHCVEKFFKTPRLVQQGDIIAIPIEHVIGPQDDAFAYQSVQIASDCWADTETDRQQNEWLVPPSLQLCDTFIFYRVKQIGSSALDRVARYITQDTRLTQSGAVAAVAPSEAQIRQYESFMSQNAASLIDPRPCTSTARDTFDLVSVCRNTRLPVSVLLVGPRDVCKSIVDQVADKMDASVVEISFIKLSSFPSESQIKNAIMTEIIKAKRMMKCILCIRHCEALNPRDEACFASVLVECIQQLSMTHTEPGSFQSVPLIASTEDDVLPASICRAFAYQTRVELPSVEDRTLFLTYLARRHKFQSEIDWNVIAQKLPNATFHQLESMMQTIAENAIQTKTLAESMEISCEDVLDAVELCQHVDQCKIPKVYWEDVGGLEDIKQEIVDLVQLPLQHPELFHSNIAMRSGLLLYGPPGTGKTLIAKAIATECQLRFLNIKGPELLNMYIGESERNIRQLFARARAAQPCILFFDELDALAPMRGRGSDSSGVMDRVVSQLLTEIDGVQSSRKHEQIYVIGATNRPDLLDTALLRPGRFDRMVYLGVPTAIDAHVKILKALTREFTLDDDVDFHQVVMRTSQRALTGADCYAIASNALATALHERIIKLEQSSTDSTVQASTELPTVVRQAHFFHSIQRLKPSVSSADLKHYERLRAQFEGNFRSETDL
uniref:Peroxisomal ATPase PEX6 n=1 Tax=Albugo laibachii Nc14 TaxID=890382 RepID=F0WZP0_9STRA|nr:peroxisome assembly factor putative [Albugo laibachii Nc14]|eukprot:CCA26966.1 peroxisome assembly factor putative [Albugo laibachii Nc14]